MAEMRQRKEYQDLEAENGDDLESESDLLPGDHAALPPVDLDADTFGMSVCSLTRDSFFISVEGVSGARILRLVTSVLLVVLTIAIQVFLLMKVKEFVCGRAVHDIRIAYDKFEVAIYGLENCTITSHGGHRGMLDRMPTFDVMQARLDAMPLDDQDNACRIPLSQPYFFGLVLTIWTLTCVFELRKACSLQMTITMLERVESMAESVGVDDDEDSGGFGKVIKGMTLCHKTLLTVFTFIPRVGICVYLLYVGCRWLLATNCFADLILNAVALEFILCIKETLYNALMPARSQFDLGVTKIVAYPTHLSSDWFNFVNTLSVLFISMGWVWLYMHKLQEVLPGYNGDVCSVCEAYIKKRYAV